MATSVQDMRENYPVPAYYYNVSIDSKDYMFQEVSGLCIEYNTLSYRHGLSPQTGELLMPGMGTPVDVVLKKGVIRKDDYLYKWLGTIKINTVEKRDIIISLMDNEDNPVVTWTVVAAFPVKMDAPTFDATANEIAIESMNLLASDLKIEYS
jgi:phage tail-like protein